MSVVFYDSEKMKSAILPDVQGSLNTINSAISNANNISFPGNVGWDSVQGDLSSIKADHQKFVSWVEMLQQQYFILQDNMESVVSKIDSTTLKKRVNIVKKM